VLNLNILKYQPKGKRNLGGPLKRLKDSVSIDLIPEREMMMMNLNSE
jgi:hypothetical protein